MYPEALHIPSSRATLVAQEVRDVAMEELSLTATIRIGVSGNGGSFSEKAAIQYALERYKREGGTNPLQVLIVYLIDAKGVLQALHDGRIDRGVFPLMNNHGGVVREFLDDILERRSTSEKGEDGKSILIDLPVRHVMIRQKKSLRKPRYIVTQPQAFEQCKRTVGEKWRGVTVIPYEDTATAAAHLADGTLVERLAQTDAKYTGIPMGRIGVIGPEDCVHLHTDEEGKGLLKVGHDGSFLNSRLVNRGRGIQDYENNKTTFVVVEKFSEQVYEQATF